MSTDYRPLKDIAAREMFDGRLKTFGVREHVATDTTESTRFLTDGRNYLIVYINPAGAVTSITRRGGNAPKRILNAITTAFDTEIVSEYDGRFWGFESQEAFDKWMEDESRASQEKSYAEVLRYVRGETHNFIPGTLGMIWADEVKKRVSERPELLFPENKDEFRATLEQISDHRRNVVVLTDQDIAFADMIATHEDDLPSA